MSVREKARRHGAALYRGTGAHEIDVLTGRPRYVDFIDENNSHNEKDTKMNEKKTGTVKDLGLSQLADEIDKYRVDFESTEWLGIELLDGACDHLQNVALDFIDIANLCKSGKDDLNSEQVLRLVKSLISERDCAQAAVRDAGEMLNILEVALADVALAASLEDSEKRTCELIAIKALAKYKSSLYRTGCGVLRRDLLATPVDLAMQVFNEYAAMDAPTLPDCEFSSLQVLLCRWQAQEFGGGDLKSNALGVSEEVGELCHAVLKQSQGIRGYDDYEKFREDAGDAVADIVIFCIQMATLLRLDFWTLLSETAEVVMRRKWKKGEDNE